MGLNLNKSRANYPKRCFWYKNENDVSKLVMDPKVMGLFYARITSKNNNPYTQGTIRHITHTVMIETPDAVNMKPDYFVKMDGKIYRIVSVDDIPLGRGRLNYIITMQRNDKS